MFNKLSVRWRVVLGFLGVLGVAMTAFLIIGRQLHKSYELNRMLAYQFTPKAVNISRLDRAINIRNSNLRGYIVANQARLSQRYDAAAVEVKEALAQLNSLPQNRSERMLIAELTRKTQEFDVEAKRVLVIHEAAGREQDVEKRDLTHEKAFNMQQSRIEPLAYEISNLAQEYSRLNQQNLQSHMNALDETARTTLRDMLIIGAAALLLAVIVTVTTINAVSKPARRLMAAAESIEHGNYAASDDLENWRKTASKNSNPGQNEMLRLASSFSSMVKELRRRQEKLAAYGEVSAVCASTIDLDTLLSSAIKILVDKTDSQFAIAHIVSNDKSTLVPAAGFAVDLDNTLHELKVGEGIPGQAVKSRTSLVVNDISPDQGIIIKLGVGDFIPEAVVSIPLISENEVLGVITFASVRAYTDEVIDFLQKCSGTLAAGVHNALTHKQVSRMAGELEHKNNLLEEHNQELQAQNEEIHAQAEELAELNERLAEQHEKLEATLSESRSKAHTLAILSEVGRDITAALEFEQLIPVIEDRIRQLLDADASSIYLYDERKQGYFISGGNQLRRQHAVKEHYDECEDVAAVVARTGEAQIVADVLNCEHCKYSSMACNDGGKHHMLSVPLIYKGKSIGAFNAFRQNKPVFTESDVEVLSTLANSVAIALENARTYEQQYDIAEKLQRSFLPPSNFNVPGYSVGCHYTPAVEKTKVGGDFYDVINIDDDRIAVVMGDVSGKGIEAAVYTGMVRYLLRGFLLSNPNPCEAMGRLNNALLTDPTPPEIFITLFLGILDTRKNEMVYVNAGHDQPLFYSESKKCCIPCDVTGRALGMLPDSDYACRTVEFAPGDMVVIYTDGITEARNGGDFLGIEGLEEIIHKVAEKPANEVVSSVFDGVLNYAEKKLNDDAAVLVLKAVVN